MLTRRSLAVSLVALQGMWLAPALAQAPAKDVLVVAQPYDLQNIDPSANTEDLNTVINENVFETLFAFDKDWKPAPVLAAALPEFGDGGKLVTIKLRTGVPFHDGSTMTADDVVASLKRWVAVSPRGKLAGTVITGIEATAPDTVQLTLSKPYAPLIPLMTFLNSPAAVMPKAKAEAFKDKPITRIEDMVGTGPFKWVERKPDQYIRLGKFDAYKSPEGPANGYAGKREALVSEIRFVPVPNANTRLESALAGQYDIGEQLSTEQIDRLKKSDKVDPVIQKPGNWLFMLLNTKEGITKNQKFRQAVQAALDHDAMLMAGLGSKEFFVTRSSLYGEGSPFFSKNGEALFNKRDPELAKTLLQEAGYKGEPFRILTSPQRDLYYKAALVAAQNLQEVGINVDVQVMDWASVMSKRADPAIWEATVTNHGFVPEPTLITIVNPAYVGWWDTPAKKAALEEFNSTVDPAARAAAWGKMQTLLMEEVPTIIIGEFFVPRAVSKNVTGDLVPPLTPSWNIGKK
jgi:peptide/nickel transport system substrate-binding protein